MQNSGEKNVLENVLRARPVRNGRIIWEVGFCEWQVDGTTLG
jgi:hypothetical protein